MRLFVPNPDFIDEIKSEDGFRSGMVAAANVAKSRAAQLAPRGKTGSTARSFVVVVEEDEILIGNTDFAFHMTEFGSANNPPYAPLRRGVAAAGLKLRGT